MPFKSSILKVSQNQDTYSVTTLLESLLYWNGQGRDMHLQDVETLRTVLVSLKSRKIQFCGCFYIKVSQIKRLWVQSWAPPFIHKPINYQ